MTRAERTEIKALIRFYERYGWDWGWAVEFLCWKYNGRHPLVIRTQVGLVYKRKKRRRIQEASELKGQQPNA